MPNLQHQLVQRLSQSSKNNPGDFPVEVQKALDLWGPNEEHMIQYFFQKVYGSGHRTTTQMAENIVRVECEMIEMHARLEELERTCVLRVLLSEKVAVFRRERELLRGENARLTGDSGMGIKICDYVRKGSLRRRSIEYMEPIDEE
jgi:hypothetical protein